MDQKQHEIILEFAHDPGMEGWYCPTCGRRILFLSSPNHQMVIVEPGDQFASHRGSTGGLRIGLVGIEQGEKADEISEERLRPWIKALEKLNLDL